MDLFAFGYQQNPTRGLTVRASKQLWEPQTNPLLGNCVDAWYFKALHRTSKCHSGPWVPSGKRGNGGRTDSARALPITLPAPGHFNTVLVHEVGSLFLLAREHPAHYEGHVRGFAQRHPEKVGDRWKCRDTDAKEAQSRQETTQLPRPPGTNPRCAPPGPSEVPNRMDHNSDLSASPLLVLLRCLVLSSINCLHLCGLMGAQF